MMAAAPMMVPVFVVGLAQLPASILAFELQINGLSNGLQECSRARPNSTTRTRSVPKTRVQTSQASRGTLAASYVRSSAALSASSRHGPIATSPGGAHRRSSTLPCQRCGPPYVAEAFGAHRAGAARATVIRTSPNENRLVALREALGRLSRRRRRVPRGRRERWAKRTPAFTLLLQQRGELSNVRNVVNQSEAVVACQLLQKKRCPGGQSTRAALTAAS